MTSSYPIKKTFILCGNRKKFIEGMDRGTWKALKERLFVPTNKLNGVVENKIEKG